MSHSTRRKVRNKSTTSNNLITNFIDDPALDPAEPKSKKIKKSSSTETSENVNPDDSLKFFKKLKPRAAKPAPPSTSSNLATNFIDESNKASLSSDSKKTRQKAASSTRPRLKDKKSSDKTHKMINQFVTENCLQDGIDPEEIQLAMALSESLKDQTPGDKAKFENPFASLGKVQPITAVLERFGFKHKNYSEYELNMIANMKLKKRSKFQKAPTELTRMSNEKRNKIIEKKIERILDMNSQDSVESTKESPLDYQIFSYNLQTFEEKSKTVFFASSDSRSTDETLLGFFVENLFEPSFIKAGHLLKDWSKIQGRDRSPCRTLESGEEDPREETEVEAEKPGEPEVSESRPEGPKNPEKSEKPEVPRTPEVSEKPEVPETTDKHQLEVLHISKIPEKSGAISGAMFEADKVEKETVMSRPFEPPPETEDRRSSEADKNSNLSCSDLFADLEDFGSENSSEDFQTSAVSDTSPGNLALHLDELQDKLTQRDEEMPLEEPVESSSKPVNIESKEKTDFSSDDSDTILIDQGSENLPGDFPSINFDESTKRQSSQPSGGADPEKSPKVASLTSTDSDLRCFRKSSNIAELSIHETQQSKDETQKFEDDFKDFTIYDDEPMEEPHLTQNSSQPASCSTNPIVLSSDDQECQLSQNSQFADDPIEISDEEIDYSIKQFYNDKLDPSDSSSQAENSVDLTQELDQTLADAMHQHEDVEDINNTVSNLLEKSVALTGSNEPKKDRSMSLLAWDHFEGDAIYDDGFSFKANTSGSFVKMKSDVSGRTKKKSVFQAIDDFNVTFEDHKTAKENFIPSERRKSHKGIPRVRHDDCFTVDTDTTVSQADYKNMTPVELKQALFKFGIRPLAGKKAVGLLEYIFDQLHPEIRSNADQDVGTNESRATVLNVTDFVTNINASEDDSFAFQLGSAGDEDLILPKTSKTKTPSCAVPLHISFYNMVRSSKTLQKFILEYRPIDLDHLVKHFRKFGLSYELNDIIAFLDKQCITFKTKDQSYSKTHERKKKKIVKK